MKDFKSMTHEELEIELLKTGRTIPKLTLWKIIKIVIKEKLKLKELLK